MLSLSDLNQFIGTTEWYCHSSGFFTYTSGVKYVAQKAQAYWLLDLIAKAQTTTIIKKDQMLQEIQFWKLQVKANHTALLICERDENDVALTQPIEYVDFPLPEIKLK